MTNTLGQFTIKKELAVFQLNYNRSIKDWLEIGISFLLGILILGLFFSIVYFGIRKDTVFALILSLSTLFIAYTLFRKFSYLILKLFAPTKQLVFIDHHLGNINIKLPYNKTKTFKKSDIQQVVYQLKSDMVDFSDQVLISRFWVEVILIQKDGNPLLLLIINPEDIIESNAYKIKRNLKKIGKGIARTLAKEIGVSYQFNKSKFPKY